MIEITIVTMLNVTRLIVGTIILFYASYTDIKTRKASNILWIIMGSAGAILLLIQYFTVGFDKIVDINETARSLRILDGVDDLLDAIEHCSRCRSMNRRDPRRFMNLLCYRNIDWSFMPSQLDKYNGRTNAGWVDSFSDEQRLLCIMYETLMEITLSAH